MTTRFLRIAEITRPRGPISKSKLYADARAGLVEIRKIGGLSMVTEAAWAAYLSGEPLHSNSRAA